MTLVSEKPAALHRRPAGQSRLERRPLTTATSARAAHARTRRSNRSWGSETAFAPEPVARSCLLPHVSPPGEFHLVKIRSMAGSIS